MHGKHYPPLKHLMLFCALALFFFVFLEATLFFQTSMSYLNGPGKNLSQLPIQGASTIGLFAFPLVNRFIPQNCRKAFVGATTLLGIASLISVAQGPTPYLIVAAGSVSFLLIGLAGGAVYWATCAESRKITHFATFMGASHALAMVMQIPLYGLTPNRVGEAVVLSVGIVVLSALIVATWPPKSELESMKAYQPTRTDGLIEENPQIGWRLNHMSAPVAISLMLALVLLFALLFNTLYGLTSSEVTTWTSQYTDATPRLGLAAGGLLAGILFDIKRARYLGITMFSISLLTAAAVLGMQTGMPESIGRAVYFYGSGAFMTFYTTSFIWIAPHFHVPDFWSGMGRALNNLTAIAVGAPSLLIIQSSNSAAVTVTLLPLLIAIIALLFATGMMHLSPRKADSLAKENGGTYLPASISENTHANGSAHASESCAAKDATDANAQASEPFVPAKSTAEASESAQASSAPDEQTAEQRCANFAERYGLTPREVEVLAAVTADDKPLKQVAADLGISLRVVQRHLTSLYGKTETQSRVGLTMLFWQ